MGIRPTRPSDLEWTARERSVFRLAATFAGFGILTLVLPLFGLQFRKLATLGDKAWIGGIVMIALGGLVATIATARHYSRGRSGVALPRIPRRFWLGALAVAGGLLLIFVVVGVASLASRRAHVPPTIGSVPGQARGPAPMSAPSGPSDPVARFGAEKTVRLLLVGADGLDVTQTMRQKAPTLADPGGNRSWKSSQEAGRVVVTFGPVLDIDGLARRIDSGTVTDVDRESRALTIAVDRTRFAEKKRQPG